MKYLCLFTLLLILTSNIHFTNSAKFNISKFKNFLDNLKPGENISSINKKLHNIQNGKQLGYVIVDDDNDFKNRQNNSNSNEMNQLYKRFRFSESSGSNRKSKLTEKSQLMKKLFLKNPAITQDWLTLQSDFFSNNSDFPNLNLPSGSEVKYNIDDDNKLTNDNYISTPANDAIGLSKYYFYVRVNSDYIYVTLNSQDFTTVFSLRLNKVTKVTNLNTADNCFEVKTSALKSKKNPVFKFCALTRNSVVLYSCLIDKLSSNKPYDICLNPPAILPLPTKKTVQRMLRQPYIIIPSPQRMCNQGWNYLKKGSDWECMCKEGKEQSPIDLPTTDVAIPSSATPIFDYDLVNTGDDKSAKLKITNYKNALHIKADLPELIKERGFGRVVTKDGTVYYATEITFHTPSEHTINGKQYAMEIQVIHEARSVGDYAKKMILSFLFVGTPGVYNKFIDDIEFFNLPNPNDEYRVLYNKIYIPNVLKTIEDPSLNIMNPFSFYTYTGSLSEPPCVENVIHYVASKPIPASITSLDMFKEAMRMPDFEDGHGNIVLAKDLPLENARDVQPLNGRSIFVYDHKLYNVPVFQTNKKDDDDDFMKTKGGHYEKQLVTVSNYMYVDGSKPSGIPGAFVVSEDETK